MRTLDKTLPAHQLRTFRKARIIIIITCAEINSTANTALFRESLARLSPYIKYINNRLSGLITERLTNWASDPMGIDVIYRAPGHRYARDTCVTISDLRRAAAAPFFVLATPPSGAQLRKANFFVDLRATALLLGQARFFGFRATRRRRHANYTLIAVPSI